MIIEKGKTVTVVPSNFLDSPNFAGGGYLTFCVSTIKKIIVSTNALNICFLIVTTSLPDCVYGNCWHNRPVFTVSDLPLSENLTKDLYTQFNSYSSAFYQIEIYFKNLLKFSRNSGKINTLNKLYILEFYLGFN